MIPGPDLQALATGPLGVSDGLWAGAAGRAGPDPEKILGMLTRVRAEWAPEDDATMALTEYQSRVVQAHAGPVADLVRKLTWNRYVILQPLGKGGMGTVYKGWDPKDRRYVALKKPLDEGGETVARLRKEGELLERLDHPNVAKLYAVEMIDDLPLLVLEFVSGMELRRLVDEKVKAKQRIPWPSVAELGVDLLTALAAVHALDIIHRDIKPANVVLREVGTKYSAVLVDLGLGKQLGGPGLTTNLLPMGTLAYMAPEQWRGGASAEPASDVYSLAITLFEVLAGQTPFRGPELHEYCLQHMNEPPPAVTQFRPDVPPQFDRLLQRMLSKKPADRGSARGLLAEFGKLTGLDSADLPPRSPPPPVPPVVRRHTPAQPVPQVRRPVERVPPAAPPRDESHVPLRVAGPPEPGGFVRLLGLPWRILRTWLRRMGGPPDHSPP